MSSAIIILVGTLICQNDISVRSFGDQYVKAMTSFPAVQDNICIVESKKYYRMTPDETTWSSVTVCGKHVKVTASLGADLRNGGCRLLSDDSSTILNYSDKTGKWSIGYYLKIQDAQTRDFQRRQLRNFYPVATWWPYSMPNGWMTVRDILEGKSSNGMLDEHHSFTASRVERIRAQGFDAYRLHYVLHVPDLARTGQLHFPGYVDVAPGLSWQIVGGRCRFEDWFIEYGEPIHGVPMMKRGVYRTVDHDSESNQDIITPIYEVVVHKAEHYEGNLGEFNLSHYGIDSASQSVLATQGEAPPGIPPAILLGTLGMVCFLVGICILHRARRRSRVPTD